MKDLKGKFLNFSKGTWPFFLIAFVVCIFFWKVFLKGLVPLPADFIVGVYYPWLDYKWGYATGVPVKNPMTTDVVSLIYPEQMLAVDLLKSGQWPLWNPHILTGTPLFANLQAAPFSPTNFVYFILDKIDAWSVQIILQHILAALFMFLLLRHWQVSKLGAILGGIAYSFSGFNLIFSQWNGHTLSAAFVPLSLLFVDKILSEGKAVSVLALVLSLTLQLLSGYPQISFYTAIAVAILWLLRLIKEPKIILKRSFFLLVSGIFALGLSAFQLMPTAELWKLSQRSFEPHPFEWAFLPWQKIITFIAPDYFGNHATQNYWGPQDYTSNTAYVGVVAFVLASLGIWLVKKNREILFLVFLAGFALVLSFPTPISIFLWQNDIFGLRAASAHRATILFIFAAAALVGFGLDSLKQKLKLKKNLFWLFLIPTILIVGFGLHALNLKSASIRGIPVTTVALRNLVLPTGILVLTFLALFFKAKYALVFLAILELFRFGWKYTPFSPKGLVFPDTPVLQFLKSQEKPFRVTGNRVIPVNMRTPYGLDSPEGYETIHPLRISQFLSAVNSGISGTDPIGRYGTVDNDTSILLDLVNTKYYLTHKLDEKGNPSPNGKIPARFDSQRFKLVFEDKSVAVLESKSALPRSFYVSNWEIEKDDRKILDRLLDPKFPYDEKIILEENPGLVERMLFISEAYYPNWKAYVNGKETKIFRANFAFRAIAVPKGEHEIKFIYQPKSFFDGLRISVLSLAALLLLLGLWKRKP